jgi:RNA polymerase sigma-70 factor (sigma-E family)
MDFEEYVQARGAALLHYAYLLCGNWQTAEDLTQSALQDALAHWRKVTRAEHPDRYLQRMITNRYLQARRRRSSTEVVTADLTDRPQTGTDGVNAVVDRDQIRRLLARLPARSRAVLVLRYYLDLDDQAIAEAVGVAPATVRSIVSRSLGRLRLVTVHETES